MPKQAIAVIIAGFFTVAIAYAVRYGYGMLLPLMLPALSITKAEAGVIYAVYFLAYTLCSPVIGAISDRYSPRWIIAGFTALLGLGAFLMAFADSIFTATIFFVLAGIGHAACWTPVVALVQKWVPDQRRGQALSLTTVGCAFGIAGWGLLLPFIVRSNGWKAGWICMGLFGLGVAALNAILIRNPPAAFSRDKNPTGDHKTLSYFQLMKNGTLWLIGLSYMLIGFVILVPFAFLSVYATEQLGLSYRVATGLIAGIAISGAVGKLTLGFWSDKSGRIKTMIICCFLIGSGILGMLYSRNLYVIYGFTVLFGLGYGAVWPVFAAAASDFFAKASAGSVIGLWTFFLGAGSILSPMICGWTIDKTGSYTWAFLIGALGSALAMLLLLPLLNAEKCNNRKKQIESNA